DIKGLHRCGVELQVTDERGVLAKVAAELAASEANIVHVANEDEDQGTASLRFVVQVRDRVHLAQVIRNLRRLPEVRRVNRA
ncbi:MAG: ACT domain-containing protein, partial [Quisquiliibacterium sp.]